MRRKVKETATDITKARDRLAQAKIPVKRSKVRESLHHTMTGLKTAIGFAKLDYLKKSHKKKRRYVYVLYACTVIIIVYLVWYFFINK